MANQVGVRVVTDMGYSFVVCTLCGPVTVTEIAPADIAAIHMADVHDTTCQQGATK